MVNCNYWSGSKQTQGCCCNKYRIILVAIVITCLCLQFSTIQRRFKLLYNDTMKYPATDGGSRSTEWSPYTEVLPEHEALSDPPLLDILESVSVEHTQLEIVDRKDVYKVGEDIKVRINMSNGRGRSLKRGGDMLRVRIFEDRLNAAAGGYVIDHKDGSYTAVVRALWEGSPKIVVYIAYTREAIRALYHTMKELIGTRPLTANFSIGDRMEETPCHAFISKLPISTDVCDFARMNDNMSWFCAKPRDSRMTCADLSTFQLHKHLPSLPVTKAESLALNRNGEHIQPSFNVKIKGMKTNEKDLRPTCVNYDRKKLWTMRSPVGYFYNNKWNILHCKAPAQELYTKFLRNKKIALFGDSTSRQWYFDISDRFNCLPSHPNERDTMNVDKLCYNKQLNLTVEWIPHAYPGNIGYGRFAIQSIAGYMARHATEINTVFVIHMFCHVTAVHHHVFRDRMAHVRKSIEKIIEYNKNATILVKGPHTFNILSQISDYYGYLYRVIMLEEFKGLLDKIIYLDNKDMTVAKEVKPNHPPMTIVTQMVNQMLTYLVD